MPPDLRDPTRPDEWLRRARSNLALARAHGALPDVLLEDLCFDAQQSAEKAIKAVLVHHQIEFPKTHALAHLLDLLARHGVPSPKNVREAIRLSDYAVASRYVGMTEDVSEAKGILTWRRTEAARWKVTRRPAYLSSRDDPCHRRRCTETRIHRVGSRGSGP